MNTHEKEGTRWVTLRVVTKTLELELRPYFFSGLVVISYFFKKFFYKPNWINNGLKA